jgi:proteic killer suppression protein
MIKSFKHKGLRDFAQTGNPAKLAVQNPDRIRRILVALDAAKSPVMMNLPGLKFHALKGADKGRYAVWASGNWRITFAFAGVDVIDVNLEDYH